jgi:hypothetical protein
MIATIHQPNFMPWLGFFAKLSKANFYVALDNVDIILDGAKCITPRVKIKMANGAGWFKVPIIRPTDNRKINSIRISFQDDWMAVHLKTIASAYGKAPYFKKYFELYADTIANKYEHLSHLNISLIKAMCNELEIKTSIVIASEMQLQSNHATMRLVEICTQLGCNTYTSGKGALNYVEPQMFIDNNINHVMSGYNHPVYSQLHGPFEPGLSILDALMNCGKDEVKAMLVL